MRLLGLLIALSQVGFALGPMLAGLGIAEFIAGFALQETLANFASGVMILIYRPLDIGDSVEAGGASGATRLLTDDNQALVVPNGKIWGDVIKNLSAEKTREDGGLLGGVLESHPGGHAAVRSGERPGRPASARALCGGFEPAPALSALSPGSARTPNPFLPRSRAQIVQQRRKKSMQQAREPLGWLC